MRNILLLFLTMMLLGCNSSNTKKIIIKTDLPQVLPLIEEFNKNNQDLKAVIDFSENSTSWDLIIFKGQNPTNSKVRDLSGYLNTIDREIFYKDLLLSSKNNDEINYIPLSFDMSGLIYKKSKYQNKRIIAIEDFIEDKTLKFSPYWNTNFLIWFYLSNIPSFNKDKNYFDDTVFHNTAQKAKSMLKNSKETWDVNLFNKKYMHLSPWVLLSSDTIEYYFMDFSEYIAYDYEKKSEIGFSFLSSNKLVTANDDITYIGLKKESKKQEEAYEFFNWIFNSANQNLYLENNLKESGKFKLFLGELSSVVEVSQNLLPLHYPKQALFIPHKEDITSPKEIPPLWDTLKEEVFIPLFISTRNQEMEDWNELHNNLYIQWLKKYKK